MNFPTELRYTQEHEWGKLDGAEVTVGITAYAYDSLGDVVFLELPQVGRHVKRGESIGSVESVKAVSDIYSPVTGVVTAVNGAVKSALDGIAKDPYTHGWLFKIRLENQSEWNLMLSSQDYGKIAQH